ncbi:Uncharacterized protein TCM_037938 [Theobroma cacao]|uniref:DUF6857 domain-containing protein n=2 Tax=Theobroma cacao TaxID=3641 RepID=A0A061GNA8_THECC|nr:Uncharacterized protein TCM_037938 [Theobroma cacao]
MVGGGNSRRDESLVINSTNVFAALGSLKKKKKKGSEKEHPGSSSKTKGKKGGEKEAEKKEVFWAPSPLKTKSWADVDDEDDDDYYATMAPPVSSWDTHKEPEPALEESESEEECLDEADDDVEEEHENEAEAQVEVQPVVKKPPEASMVTKETERQLSKKELKKKGLEELDAVLAELGLTKPETSGPNDSHGIAQGKKSESNGEMEKKENAPAESKSAKKKKKKDKSSKEVTESSQGQPEGIDTGNDAEETGETEKPEETSAVDVKERLKKVVSMKKKKSSKEMDAAARGAANEAAARSARFAAAKKKEKNHYNQQPMRLFSELSSKSKAGNSLPTVDQFLSIYDVVVKYTVLVESVAASHNSDTENASSEHSKSSSLRVEVALAADLEITSFLTPQNNGSPSALQRKFVERAISSCFRQKILKKLLHRCNVE